MNAWCTALVLHEQRAALGEAGLRRWQYNSVARAWLSWHMVVQVGAQYFRQSVMAAARLAESQRSHSYAAAWRSWSALCMEQHRAGYNEGLVDLMRQLIGQKLLRRIVQAWARHASGSSIEGTRRLLAKRWKRSASAFVTHKDILIYLMPAQRAQWPKAWLDFFGWHMTWRELPIWLESLVAKGLPWQSRANGSSELLGQLCQGALYDHLVRLASPTHYARHRGEERDPDDWRHMLLTFFQSEYAASILGSGLELCNIVRRGKPVDHLAVLTALRVVIEVNEASMWRRFVASLLEPHVQQARMPRLSQHDPLDDMSEVTAGATCNFVCGCPTPRILLHNMRCGKCTVRATVSTEEYLEIFTANQQVMFDRSH